MQNSDREFIEKYKQKQFQMLHPVPEVVAPVAAKEVAPVAAKEVAPVAAKEVAPVAAKEVAQEAAKEVVQEAVQVAVQESIKIANNTEIVDDENQVNALQLIKSALDQINYALHLLEGAKKKPTKLMPISEEAEEKLESKAVSETNLSEPKAVSETNLSEPKAVSEPNLSEQKAVSEPNLSEPKAVSEPNLPETNLSEPKAVSEINLSEPKAVSETNLSEPKAVSETNSLIQIIVQPSPASAELVNNDYISDVDVDADAEPQKEKEEEFKIVMPKKSKNKKVAIATVLPLKEKAKKDDFPSLGSIESSFSQIKKPGFWGGEPRKSLEIAKAIAHIPSPTPISSPSPNLKKSIRMVRGGQANNDSEDEYFDGSEEFRIRKRGGDYDD